MTPNQINIAETFLQHLKVKNGAESINNMWQMIPVTNSRDRHIVVNALVDEHKLIRVSGSVYILTREGVKFTSYKDLLVAEAQAEEKEAIDFEKAKIDLVLNKWLLKTRWLPHLIAAVSVAISLYVLFAPDNKYIELERRIKVLEKQIKEEKAQTGKSIMSTGSVKSAVIEKSQTTPNP